MEHRTGDLVGEPKLDSRAGDRIVARVDSRTSAREPVSASDSSGSGTAGAAEPDVRIVSAAAATTWRGSSGRLGRTTSPWYSFDEMELDIAIDALSFNEENRFGTATLIGHNGSGKWLSPACRSAVCAEANTRLAVAPCPVC